MPSFLLKDHKEPIEVFILWRPLAEALPALLARQTREQKEFAIAAVLPSQKLDCALLDLLEEHGLLLIEFPDYFSNFTAEQVTLAIGISTYLDRELAESTDHIKIADQVETLLKKMDGTLPEACTPTRKMTKKEKEQFLADLNNPDAEDLF